MVDRVIGIGSIDRGDDGVGPAVAAAVARRTGPSTDVVVSTADPSRLIDLWDGADDVVLIDAVVDGSAPGSICIIDAVTQPLPTDAGEVSSHGMGLGAAVALGRSLGRLPERLTVIGVSAEGFEGSGLSVPVERAVAGATDIVMEMVEHA